MLNSINAMTGSRWVSASILGSRVISVVRIKGRVKIRFFDVVAVAASDHSAELPPVHESSQ